MNTDVKKDGEQPVSESFSPQDYFKNLSTPEYSKFIHLSRYARYRDDLGRRETWEETVERYFGFFDGHVAEHHPKGLGAYQKIRSELKDAILNMKILPSMRGIMSAGKALERDNVALFNCSFLSCSEPRAFDEAMYLLMCGTGVGFSVEQQYVSKLPTIAEEFHETDTTIVVPDSKLGWASSYRELVAMLYAGRIPRWDLSRLRPAGARLKTMGGRSSGPTPLDDLFRFTLATFKNAAGRKLTSIECHDIFCKVGDIVVVGGVRRSALISLSDLNDDKMRTAKSGKWWEHSPQRALANNSVAYANKPDMETFLREWLALVESKSGERGIFNVAAAQMHAAKNGRRDASKIAGCNPCSEILLRNKGVCNLSEVIVRENDTEETLKEKIRLATILGTLQATVTNFRYLSKEWKKNAEEEALLGVSFTGIMDNPILNKNDAELPLLLERLKEHAIKVNKEWAQKFGIKQSAGVTCTKPAGTTSALTNTASGIHARHSPYYIRTVRADIKDPLAQMMKDAGFPHEPDVTKPNDVCVFSFPMKSPAGAICRNDMSAIEQLEIWKTYALHWCEHKPSVTVSVKEAEWLEAACFVYKNFDIMSGVSFLPYSDHIYQQPPYQEVDKRRYDELLAKMPTGVDWSRLSEYEHEDTTTGTQTLACSAGSCEIVDLVK